MLLQLPGKPCHLLANLLVTASLVRMTLLGEGVVKEWGVFRPCVMHLGCGQQTLCWPWKENPLGKGWSCCVVTLEIHWEAERCRLWLRAHECLFLFGFVNRYVRNLGLRVAKNLDGEGHFLVTSGKSQLQGSPAGDRGHLAARSSESCSGGSPGLVILSLPLASLLL